MSCKGFCLAPLRLRRVEQEAARDSSKGTHFISILLIVAKSNKHMPTCAAAKVKSRDCELSACPPSVTSCTALHSHDRS
eukprot:12030-Heterococcus_DN1.PRE.2